MDVLAWLEEWSRRTPRHSDGSILGSMTTQPHPTAVKAFTEFIHVNGNDPVVFPVVREALEILVKGVGGLIKAQHGLYTSGGTESNILALYVARKLRGGEIGRAHV